MKIKYIGRRGVDPLQLGGVQGDDALWAIDQVREYAANATLRVRFAGALSEVNAIGHILDSGPWFVDADTGKNPRLSCADCGEPATAQRFQDPRTLEIVEYANDAGDPLCMTHFIVRNPKWLAHHKKYAQDPTHARAAAKILNELNSAKAADAAKTVSAVAAAVRPATPVGAASPGSEEG